MLGSQIWQGGGELHIARDNSTIFWGFRDFSEKNGVVTAFLEKISPKVEIDNTLRKPR